MARTSVSDVDDIFENDLSTGQMTAWIDVANELVDDIEDASSLDATRLTKIEKLLAAHFASVQDPLTEEDSVGDSSFVYQGEWGEGIMSTTYGQQAAMLDTTGTLRSSGRHTANISVLDSRGVDD